MSLYTSPLKPNNKSEGSMPSYVYMAAIYLAAVALVNATSVLYFQAKTNFEYFGLATASCLLLYMALSAFLLFRPLLQLAYPAFVFVLCGVVAVALFLSGVMKDGIPDTALAAGYFQYHPALAYIGAPTLVPNVLFPEWNSISPQQYRMLAVANTTAGTLWQLFLVVKILRGRKTGVSSLAPEHAN